jgi:predicted unusual protein kinase regulating ubiquinone biosynthesis (AarF/ABC1/UbiB family)
MHFSLLREFVRNELGRDLEEVFESFETRPFAAASLGQVHRARLKSGETVAVKIQYPSIVTTIRSDFRNLRALMMPMRLSKDWEDLKESLADLQRVLEQETDYEREADTLNKARALFGEDDRIVLPRVYESFSSLRVLTMEYLKGVHIHDYLARNPSQQERDHFGAQILRAYSRMYYAGRMNYADMHPGNFLFQEDGRLGVLDFGCVRPFNDEEWALLRSGPRAIYGDRQGLLRFTKRVSNLPDDYPDDSDQVRVLERLSLWSLQPMRQGGSFDYGNGEHLREGANIFREMVRKGYTRGQPLCVLIARMHFGSRALLYRLRARVNSRAIEREESIVTGWPSPEFPTS